MPAAKRSEGGSESVLRPLGDPGSDVKADLTDVEPCGKCKHQRYVHRSKCDVTGCGCSVWRRSKPVSGERETLPYIDAARRFIRAAGRRVGDADEHELAALIALQADLEKAIRDAVAGQRAHGKSWAQIARGTGTTREAAFQRWRDR